MKAGARRRCRQCGTGLVYARERDVRVALEVWVDAEPLSPLVPLERAPPGLTLWERHPAHGWRCMDFPQRNGFPVFVEHTHKNTHKKESIR
jgi:hypothetical protein